MTAIEHYTALIDSYPIILSDRDWDGMPTDEASDRAYKWAMEQLSEAERCELTDHWKRELAEEMLEEYMTRKTAEGEIVRFIDEDTCNDSYIQAKDYGNHEGATASLDAMVAAGTIVRGADDVETGEARFFAVQREVSSSDLTKPRGDAIPRDCGPSYRRGKGEHQ
jgi:hypothetical protein